MSFIFRNGKTNKDVTLDASDEKLYVNDEPIVENAVLYTQQSLTSEQQAQALQNLGIINAQNISY